MPRLVVTNPPIQHIGKSYRRVFRTEEDRDNAWRLIYDLKDNGAIYHITRCSTGRHWFSEINIWVYATDLGHARLEQLFA